RGGGRSADQDSRCHKVVCRSVGAVMNSLKYGIPVPAQFGGYKGIIAKCGGKLCVKIKVRAAPSHPELTRCRTQGVTGPRYDRVAPRGSTIRVLTGNPATRLPVRMPPSARPAVALTRALRGSP